MKLCIDCRHSKNGFDCGMAGIPFPATFCHRPVAHPMNPVTGTTSHPLYKPAREERCHPVWIFNRNRCGPDAKFWEARK